MPHSEHLIHTMDKKNNANGGMIFIVILVALLMGAGTGFFSSKVFSGKGIGMPAAGTEEAEKTADGTAKTAGIKDTKVFKDSAEGTLREGGFEDEGSFHLERPGGKSQNVYLTSSTVDLSQFVGKKVSVLGKTFDSEKAGWLMDVGYIELK